MSLIEFSTSTAKDRKAARAQARKASELLKALSHEGRFLILCSLMQGEKSVSEIEEIMDLPQAAVSQQLARLRLDGLVSARRDGRSIHYSLASLQAKAVVSSLHKLYGSAQRGPARRSPQA